MGTHTKDKIVSSKVNLQTYAQILKIARGAKISIYNIVQTIVGCIVKVFCEREPMSDEVREVFYKFVDLDRAKNGFSLAAPILHDLQMTKCLAIISMKKKEIPEIVLLEKDGEQITENKNNDEILTVFLQAFSPKILRGLQKIMQQENFHNLTDALFFAIHETAVDPGDVLHDEVLQIFEETNNLSYTASPEIGSRKDVDNMPQSCFELKARKRPYTLSFEVQEKMREKQRQKEELKTLQYTEDLQQLKQRRAGVEFVRLNEYEDETFCFDDD